MKEMRKEMNELNDITVEQFIKLHHIEYFFKDDNKIKEEIEKLFLTKDEINGIDLDKFHIDLKYVLSSTPRFIQRFYYKGVEYGFIPNLSKISTGEYNDINKYQTDLITYDKLISILYRPIIKKSGKKYLIENYSGPTEIMREVSCEVLLGCLGYFFNLSESMLKVSLNLIKKEKEKL